MSILLEALRKSEKSQRSREVPTIHTEVPSAPPGGHFSRAFSIATLVLVFAASGWFAWKQYRMPETTDAMAGQPQAPLSKAKGRPSSAGNDAGAAPDVAAPGRSAVTAREDSTARQTGDAEAPPRNQLASVPVDAAPANRRRTPVETFEPPAGVSNEQPHATDQAPVEKSPEATRRRSRSFPTMSVQATAAGKNEEAGANEGVKDQPREQTAFRPQEPEMLGYWDLPDSIRADVPEFKFTVLVYDKVPENRFVLVNGERYAEGDTQPPGLVVEEIRREGVIYSYRLYRFLVKK